MSRWPQTRASRWGARQDERDRFIAQQRASLQSNPRQVVENIVSRQSIARSVDARMIFESQRGEVLNPYEAAVEYVANDRGLPHEVVRECVSIEKLESGQ